MREMLASLAAMAAASPVSFLVPGATVQVVASNMVFTEGPVMLRDGSLVFSDIPANRMVRIKDGQAADFRNPSFNANGNTLDRQGRLITCEHGRRQVIRQEKDGSVTVLASEFGGRKLNSPNDAWVRRDGAIFFTDPPYGIQQSQKEQPVNGVYCLKDGVLTLIASDFDRPNGIVASPNERTLYVADTARGHIRSFPLNSDGTLGIGQVLAMTPTPDGLRVDRRGNIWSASGNGINVISPAGDVLEVIKMPEIPANLAFSRDGRTLFVTARRGLYSIKVNARGIAP